MKSPGPLSGLRELLQFRLVGINEYLRLREAPFDWTPPKSRLSAQDIAGAPVSVLSGVSEGDAELLLKAFGIKTVRDLGTNKYFRWAQGISALAD